jgi:hypothetical protein
MRHLRALMSQSPAIAIATAALVISAASGAAASAVMTHGTATRVTWHNLTLINGWGNTGAFDSFRAGYYVDANHIVHLRGSARLGSSGTAAFRLPRGVRPSHVLSVVIYSDTGPAEMNILPNGLAKPFNPGSTGSNVSDFTSFDGVTFAQG